VHSQDAAVIQREEDFKDPLIDAEDLPPPDLAEAGLAIAGRDYFRL
jgi:hypothetical protein